MDRKQAEEEEDKRFYTFSFQNAPPNLCSAFKKYADSTLSGCHQRLAASIDNVDIDGAMYHIVVLSKYLELKYPINQRTRVSIARLCFRLLLDFPIDLSQQITLRLPP